MADYKFVKIFGERNTGTRALSRMLSGQPEVRMRPIGEAGAMNLPENEDLRDVIDTTYQGKWRKVYRDAVTGYVLLLQTAPYQYRIRLEGESTYPSRPLSGSALRLLSFSHSDR